MKNLLLLLSLSLPLYAYAGNWSEVSKPTIGKTESIGSYSAGCISGAQTLPLDGVGYLVMRPSRNRYYTHPEMMDYIKNLGAQAKEHLNRELLIGDASQPRGGPMISGHASHQIGLDVDIWFMPSPSPTLTTKEREELSAESVLKDKEKLTLDETKLLKYSFDYFPKVLKLAASNEKVDRIFVTPAMKKELCENYVHEPWLKKIRPWWGHDSHFHVRLKCPAGNTSCENQEPIKDDGCGKELDYWFSQQAKDDFAKMMKEPKKEPVLPEGCKKILAE